MNEAIHAQNADNLRRSFCKLISFFQETSKSLKSDENNFVKVPYTEDVEQKHNTPKSGITQINSNKTKTESNTGT